MKRMVLLLLTCGLLLSGCGFMNGSYVSVKPHQEQRQSIQPSVIAASNYMDLMDALEDLIASGTENATILVAQYPSAALDTGMAVAMSYVLESDPIGAYAVESIDYEIGYIGGQPAMAVQIHYLHSHADIRRIRKVDNMTAVRKVIENALESYESNVVMLVNNYYDFDLVQQVRDYAEENPHLVMELPQVSMNVYGKGRQRVLEMKFGYQTDRDDMRQMRSQVEPVFEAAVLYVSGNGSQWQKYSQLYSFLMERFDYTLETSITPAYSLLHHGVGDSRAFATVFSSMCKAAGLECQIVKGTREGEPWSWNLVYDNGYYYHVDLLTCSEQGKYGEKTDAQMQGYVWDYSAYPACTGRPRQEEERNDLPGTDTEVQEEVPEATHPTVIEILEENEKNT